MTTMDNSTAASVAQEPVPPRLANEWGGPMPPADGKWRKRTSDTLPEGRIWLSDGAKVWMTVSTGLPGHFAAATRCLYWMPAEAPPPPTADEIAAMDQAA